MIDDDELTDADLEDARRTELEVEADDLEDDETRPDGRSDAGDPWHGLNDFDDAPPNP